MSLRSLIVFVCALSLPDPAFGVIKDLHLPSIFSSGSGVTPKVTKREQKVSPARGGSPYLDLRPSQNAGFCDNYVQNTLANRKFPRTEAFLHKNNCHNHKCRSLITLNQHHVERYVKPPPDMLPDDGQAALGTYKWKKCAVVGNAGALLHKNQQYGSTIDAHEVIFRINQAPTTKYVESVGVRTTHRLLNRLWTLAYADSRLVSLKYRWSQWPHALEDGVTLVSSRTGPESFVSLKRKMRSVSPRTPVHMLNERTVHFAEELLEGFRQCMRRRERTTFFGGTEPTSGLVAVVLLHNLCEKVSVFGIAQPERHEGTKFPYQYYTLHQTQRPMGNEVHSFTGEDALIHTLSRVGAINLCTPAGCTAPSVQPAGAKGRKASPPEAKAEIKPAATQELQSTGSHASRHSHHRRRDDRAHSLERARRHIEKSAVAPAA